MEKKPNSIEIDENHLWKWNLQARQLQHFSKVEFLENVLNNDCLY